MGKRTAYAISISHTRPPQPSNRTFVNVYHIKSDGEPEYLCETFTHAFKEAHPGWPIKEVNVEKE